MEEVELSELEYDSFLFEDGAWRIKYESLL